MEGPQGPDFPQAPCQSGVGGSEESLSSDTVGDTAHLHSPLLRSHGCPVWGTVPETNQVGNVQGMSPQGTESRDGGVGDEAGTISLEQKGESRHLKSPLRVKEGVILNVQRAGPIRGKQVWVPSEKDALCLPCQGKVGTALAWPLCQRHHGGHGSSCLGEWPEDSQVPS